MDTKVASARDYLVNHIFLPIRLPQEDDEDPQKNLELCNAVLHAVQAFSQYTDCKDWLSVESMIANLLELHGQLDMQARIKLMTTMLNGATGKSVLVFPVRAQNACMIVRTYAAETVFESFRIDPPNEVIMTTIGRVVRSFPDASITVPNTSLSPEFYAELASFLANMDVDVLEDAAPSTKKAGEHVLEVRDTADSHYITGLLMAILAGLKGTYPTKINPVIKHTRNDILWSKAYKPWRRSPLWLIIKVALQTSLHQLGHGPNIYKEFMAFLMASILAAKPCLSLSSDTLFSMQSKLADRMRKLTLNGPGPSPLTELVKSILKTNKALLEERWCAIQSQGRWNPEHWNPSQLDIESDTHLLLPNSSAYLKKRLNAVQEDHTSPIFHPHEHSRLFQNGQKSDDFNPITLSAALQRDRQIALIDIEQYVLEYLGDITNFHQYPFTPSLLSEGMQIYLDHAQKEYDGNPETRSIMILTVFVLWVNLDKLVGHRIPLLFEYSPEVPTHLLEPLMLSKSLHISRYQMVQQYISARYSGHQHHFPSIFGAQSSHNAFAHHYYNGSEELKSLKCRIEADASLQRARKHKELAKLQAKRSSLLSQAQNSDHRYTARGYHSGKCHKCDLENQAKNMTITVHEWPLPEHSLQAESVVFETQAPLEFRIWRTTTYRILFELCRPGLSTSTNQSPSAQRKLVDYDGLKSYTSSNNISDITIASRTKSFGNSHYSTIKVKDATDSNVCVRNGLQFCLYDNKRSRWIGTDSFQECAIDGLCIWPIPPKGRYSHLSYAVKGTTHPPNQCLADQSAAPADLELHEHISFGSLRSGGRLQWLNIARESRAKVLSFARSEVRSLLLTAALQVGPISEVGLDWHLSLDDPDFAGPFLDEIKALTMSIAENWAHRITLETVVMLIVRLLASSHSGHTEIVSQAVNILQTARDIAFKWMNNLIKAPPAKSGDENSTETTGAAKQHICAIAAICRSTYNVEPHQLGLLFQQPKDIRIFIESLIRLHDFTPPGTPLHSLSPLLARDARLALTTAEQHLHFIDNHPDALNEAVCSIWSAYTPGYTGWKTLPAPNSCWISTTTSSDFSGRPSQVHLNLLTGSLLIDGKPLGRLPRSIIQHPTYTRLLDQQTLDVIPSNLRGMDFATRDAVSEGGFHLHFKLTGGDLLLKATRSTEIAELIPHTVFQANSARAQSDFPALFIENHCHWLSCSPDGSSFVEFRPLRTRWEPSSDNWRLKLSSHRGSVLQHGVDSTECLVDLSSRTFKMISRRLTSLERRPEYIHVISLPLQDSSLIAELPRFKLSFSLDNNELRSNNLKDMVIDHDQNIGTLYGLRDQLVLKPFSSTQEPTAQPRCVLIPYGELVFKEDGNHVAVHVETEKSATVPHFRYNINADLHSLVGTTLLSEYYRIYLHALTSHPLVDPLFGHTGTEEALKSLRSARCKSFQILTNEEKSMLLHISELNAGRAWYPKNLKVMQTVTWKEVGPLSQHWHYPVLVDSILKFNDELSIFNPNPTEATPDFLSKNRHLASRALSNHHHLYPSDDYGIDFSEFQDFFYHPVPGSTPTAQVLRGNHMALLVQEWPRSLNTAPNIWDRLRAASAPNPLLNIPKDFTLTYSRDLLNVDLAKFWLPIYLSCIGATNHRHLQAQLTFTLSAMAYRSGETQLISTFLAFATTPELRHVLPPNWDSFDLNHGTRPSLETLASIVNNFAKDVDSVSDGLYIWNSETPYTFRLRREREHERKCQEESQSIARYLDQGWKQGPCASRSKPRLSGVSFALIERTHLLEEQLGDMFLNWHKNMHFETHILNVQSILNNCKSGPLPINAVSPRPFSVMLTPIVPIHRCRPRANLLEIALQRTVDTDTLFEPVPPPLGPFTGPRAFTAEITSARGQGDQLDMLLKYFTEHKDRLHSEYGKSLQGSKASMVEIDQTSVNNPPHVNDADLTSYVQRCAKHYTAARERICQALLHLRESEEFQHLGFHWPRPTTRGLLEILLRLNPDDPSSVHWITALRAFAGSLLFLQRAKRLLFFWQTSRLNEFTRELSNVPSIETQAPVWIVIQIEGDFLARQIQLRVANEMMAPTSDENTVIQLNMGEGKSSVIVPLIASSLADGQKLARVVVLKPLAKSMFSLLVHRISGLANRRVFYLPFSRDMRMDDTQATKLYHLFKLCLKERGVLVAQPEHILSFKLMGIDLACMATDATNHRTTSKMLFTQRWLSERCRDILDESDEILNVKYQLIYTSGRPKPLENHPYRWLVIQEVLQCVEECARQFHNRQISNLEIEATDSCVFPIIRVLDGGTGNILVAKVARSLIHSERFRLLAASTRELGFSFITKQQLRPDDRRVLQEQLTPDLWQSMLLFRGLFACGILQFALQEKRWRVNYGLDPKRTLLAVPYRAKDVPALRADFGHPDVAVMLTCFSYYYGGLHPDQVSVCFQLLMKLDNPAQEYNLWVANNVDVPPALRELTGVNTDDSDQQRRLYACFRRNRATVNFYLSRVVFPREAKQFPKKLSTSAWDLAEAKSHPTTGFSGTNDNQDLLPLSIKQQDPVGQGGTNARVLECLLRPENDHYIAIRSSTTQILSSQDYLENIMRQTEPTRVLLDVGAQMLDKDSNQIARAWLDMEVTLEAIVFFDDDDQLVVMTRDHHVESFQLSYYSQKLDCCAIYLDEAHTRGTDLKLPDYYRAAVTLGPKLTKDRLVQGCMRMRKLGLGQSVAFFAPPEVDKLIRKLAGKDTADDVHAIDILRWAMDETCTSIRQGLPHWAQQGVDYKKRSNAWDEFLRVFPTARGSLAPLSPLQKLRNAWEDADARTLLEMYGSDGSTGASHPAFGDDELRKHLHSLGFCNLADVSVDEEQEREVSHEAEQEREVERPPPAKPAKHSLHADVKYLVDHGSMVAGSPAFVPIFATLAHLDSNPPRRLLWSPDLWVTDDFSKTIVGSISDATEYQRPVHWLLTMKQSTNVVALSPYEVNALLPAIRKSKAVHLHMYAPRVNPAMKSFEDLRSFTIPALSSSWLPPSPTHTTQINLWAGQLCFLDLNAYHHARMVLGIVGEVPDEDAEKWESDGFVLPKYRKGSMRTVCSFKSSPLAFLREVVGLRQKGKSYQSTHIGKILDHRSLKGKDFSS